MTVGELAGAARQGAKPLVQPVRQFGLFHPCAL
jgi:hypothetical protein